MLDISDPHLVSNDFLFELLNMWIVYENWHPYLYRNSLPE
jgi:hypothetical protein